MSFSIFWFILVWNLILDIRIRSFEWWWPDYIQVVGRSWDLNWSHYKSKLLRHLQRAVEFVFVSLFVSAINLCCWFYSLLSKYIVYFLENNGLTNFLFRFLMLWVPWVFVCLESFCGETVLVLSSLS